MSFSAVANVLIRLFFRQEGPFLDFAGGYGLFVRLMRDLGFDFYWQDKFCPNIFARESEGTRLHRYELVTAIEVVEHLPNPMGVLEEIFERSPNLLFTTLLQPRSPALPSEWWYYGLEHGQHVSFFTLDSLGVIARHFGKLLSSDGTSIHMLAEKGIPSLPFRLLTNRRLVGTLSRFLKGVNHRQALVP
jgi:hypothetical protein